MNKFLLLGFASVLGACAANADVEDPENDQFLAGDGKEDAFGVEDWSPDGAAVLDLVSKATVTQLDDEIGLSSKVAKAIVAARGTLPSHKFDDLAQLDAVKNVGKTVFGQLLKYVNDHHLFKTAFRVPLLIEDENTQKLTPIDSYNAKAHELGLTGFAKYTFVNDKTDFEAKMASYDKRLEALAAKAHITLPGEMFRYAYSFSDYEAGTAKICFIGRGEEVADVVRGQAGSMTGEMYSLWGWKYRTKKWVDDNIENPDDDFSDSSWSTWATSSKDVLLVYTNDDDGTHIADDIISQCR